MVDIGHALSIPTPDTHNICKSTKHFLNLVPHTFITTCPTQSCPIYPNPVFSPYSLFLSRPIPPIAHIHHTNTHQRPSSTTLTTDPTPSLHYLPARTPAHSHTHTRPFSPLPKEHSPIPHLNPKDIRDATKKEQSRGKPHGEKKGCHC